MDKSEGPDPLLADVDAHTRLVVFLVDRSRRIRKLNIGKNHVPATGLEEIIGRLPGELLACRNALDSPEGCGRTKACPQCGLNRIITETLETKTAFHRCAVRLARKNRDKPDVAELRVSALPMDDDDGQALVCVEDITPLEHALGEIRHRKAQMNSLFHASPIGLGFLETKIENGRVIDRIIRDVNERLCMMTGYSRDELVGKSSRILYPDQGEYDYVARKKYEQMKHESVGTAETRWKTKDGRIRQILLSSASVDPDDWTSGISFTATDITEQKKNREDREKLENRLRHTQKMEAVGKLSGGIAHEFNNLLQIINGYADLMADELEKNHPARSALNEIISAGNRAADLVRHLIAFSRRQSMQMRDIRVNDLISKTVSMLNGLIGEHIELDFIPGHYIGRVHADPAQLEQVLVNLILNARDAMPGGGTVTIETENVLINGQYCKTHDWAEPGRFVLVSVTDTGCGMDPQTASRVFEPFFTTKSEEKKNGLGLATAYGIIRQHEGMINVYSEPGKGTMFKIYLPVAERRATDVGVNLQGQVLGGSETILIAEDDEMVCDLMQTVLTRAGYRTMCARDGERAVEMFTAYQDDIDLAIIDVVMPLKNGREVHDAIKALRPDVKVVFCSGYSSNAIHTNFVLHDGLELLQKPFAADELLRKVRDLLDPGGRD